MIAPDHVVQHMVQPQWKHFTPHAKSRVHTGFPASQPMPSHAFSECMRSGARLLHHIARIALHRHFSFTENTLSLIQFLAITGMELALSDRDFPVSMHRYFLEM